MFDFKEQLDIGAEGERVFHSLYPKLNKADGIKFDFELNGHTVELKTDTYSMDRTPNFFMENVSDIDSGKIGGPWRAAQDNVDFFVYMFIQQKKCFWFRSKPLVQFLDEYCKDLYLVKIPNKGWTATGYKVPRYAVEHLYLKI
jgi:hypothetical protein